MKAYTVNNHLVGVGNSQILGTDQGGGGGVEYEAGQYISIDENNVISVTGVAPATALPTTELGKFTIQNNVSGGPIEVIVPTDDLRAASGIVIDNTAVSGCAITGSGPIMVFKSPGFDQGYWNGSSEYTLVIDLPEPISYGHSFMWCYAPNNNPTSIGYTATLDSSTTDTHFEAVMSTRHTYGETYGQYLQLFIPSNPSDYETGLSILEGATIKILGPKPIGGIKVDLDRYYLGNTSTITNISGYTQAYVYTDPTSKKQSVYLPGSIPYSWRDNVVNIIKYGSTANPNTSSIIYTGAYKEITGGWTPEYQWAICVDNNASTKIATYISYDKDGNAIEKWTYNWGTSPRTWTTETISYATEAELQAVSGTLDNYIPYSASGVYLPNSKFEIDTNGQAYKVISESNETDYNNYYDGGFYYGYNYNLPDRTETPRVMKAGTYRITVYNDNMKSLKLSGRGIFSEYNKLVIPVNDNHADLIITQDLQVTTYNDSLGIYAWTNSDGTGSIIGIASSSDATVKYIVPAVKEEYITDGDLELNGNNQVTAIDGHALAIPDVSDMATQTWVTSQGYLTEVPSNYATDQELAEAVTAVTSIIPAAQVNSDWNANSGVAEILNKPTEIQLIAGTNVQVEVTGASAIISAQGGGAGYATETYVQNYVQNYSIPVQVVASSAAATGTNILYVVTGS